MTITYMAAPSIALDPTEAATIDLVPYRTKLSLAKPTGFAIGALRRALDILLSLFVLVLSVPLLLIAALLIKAESSGPVLYRQERLGLNGMRFIILKLRTMRVDAEAAGPRWAAMGDPRITRVGRWLRLSHVDELPQLLNVIAGTMSVIGPRPERPYFSQQLASVIPRYEERFSVKPGITGWAQVNYPYCASVQDAIEKLAYDLYYVEHRSLVLDLHIMLATVGVVLTHYGAR